METKILPFLLAASGAFAADATAGIWLTGTKDGEPAQIWLPPEAAEVLAQDFDTFQPTEHERAFMPGVLHSDSNARRGPDRPLEHSLFLTLVARQYALWLHQEEFDHINLEFPGRNRRTWRINRLPTEYFLASLGVDLNGGAYLEEGWDVLAYTWNEETGEWDTVWTTDENGERVHKTEPAGLSGFSYPLLGDSRPVHLAFSSTAMVVYGDDGTRAGNEIDRHIDTLDPELGFGYTAFFAPPPSLDYQDDFEEHKVYGVGHIPGGPRGGIFVFISLNTFVNPDEDFWNQEMFRVITRSREPFATAQQFEHYRRFPWPEAEVLAGTRQRGLLRSEWFGRFFTHGHETAPWAWHEQLGWFWSRSDEFGMGLHDPPRAYPDAPGQVFEPTEPGHRILETRLGTMDNAKISNPTLAWFVYNQLEPDHPRYGKASGPGRRYEFFWTTNYNRDNPHAHKDWWYGGERFSARRPGPRIGRGGDSIGAPQLYSGRVVTFTESTESAGMWVGHNVLGMFRTTPDLWPWLYAADEGRWLYFGWGDTRTFFLYDPAQRAWIQMEEG